MYGEGISKTGDLIDVGVDAGIIEKSGSWYSYNGERIGQGRNNAKEFFKAHPDICNTVSAKLRDLLALGRGEQESV
jgi:recombination protein RecA